MKATSIQQLAHEYANKPNLESGRCGNVSYRDGGFYSFATCIARRIISKKHGTYYIMSSHNHDSSFTSKHMGAVRNALSGHEPIYCVDGGSRGSYLFEGDEDSVPDAILAHLKWCAESYMKSLIKARTSKEWKLGMVNEYMQKSNEMTAKFFPRRKPPYPDGCFAEIEASMKDAISKERKVNAAKAEANKKYAAEREAQRQKDLEQAKLDLIEWATKGGEHKHTFHSLPIMCRPRANKTLIETSNQAVIPYEAGIIAFKAFLAGPEASRMPEGTSIQIGNYSLAEVTSEYLRVGCTKILAEEINRFAIQEGWVC